MTSTDDNSKYGYIYLLRHKSEFFEKYKELKIKIDISSQYSTSWKPQQNGEVEWRNRTLFEMIRLMLSFIDLSIMFWGYPLEIANYILNWFCLNLFFNQIGIMECVQALSIEYSSSGMSIICIKRENKLILIKGKSVNFIVYQNQKN